MGIDRDFDSLSDTSTKDLEVAKIALAEVAARNYTCHNWEQRGIDLRACLEPIGVEVICYGGSEIGRCYYQTGYEVISREKLPKEFISFLRKIGMLGYGQEFWTDAPYQRDGKWIVNCIARVDSSD